MDPLTNVTSYGGITARTLTQMLRDKELGLPAAPIVITLLGTNDLLNGSSIEELRETLQDLTAILHEVTGCLSVFHVPPPTFPYNHPLFPIVGDLMNEEVYTPIHFRNFDPSYIQTKSISPRLPTPSGSEPLDPYSKSL